MKFLLTLYVCSLTTGECVMPKLEELGMKQFYGTHYGCVRAGLGDSFELLFDGKTLVLIRSKSSSFTQSFLARR